MKKTFILLPITLLMLLTSSKVFSQSNLLPCPPNIDWEFGDTTGWTAQWTSWNPANLTAGTNTTIITTPFPNFTARRHEIVTTTSPNDPYGGFSAVSPLGGQFAIKLGSDTTGTDFYRGARVQYQFTVPANDYYAINFLYAVVLNDGGHPANQQPRFTVSVLDAATGQSIKDGCYDLNFVADRSLEGFFESPADPSVICKDWTKHTLRLVGLAGKTIILDVVVGGCSASAHWGYGYFDVLNCSEYKIELDSCNLDYGGAYLSAPEGFMTYEWYNNDFSRLMDTGRYAAFQPETTTPQKYKLVVTPFPSISKCKDTFETIPLANINIDKIDTTCVPPNTAIVLNGNINGGVNGLNYSWAELNTSGALSCNNCAIPTASAAIPGSYVVTATDANECHRSEIMYVGVNENAIDAIEDFVFCHPGYTQLNSEPTGPLPLTPVTCGTNPAGCTSASQMDVQSFYRVPLQNRFDTSSLNNPFATQHSSGHMQYILNRDDLYRSGFRYGTFNSIGFQVNTAGAPTIDNMTISMGCTDRATISGVFETGTNVVYTAPAPFTPVAGWNDFTLDVPFNWDTAKSVIIDICYTVTAPDEDNRTLAVILNTGTSDAIAEYTNTTGLSVCQANPAEEFTVHAGRPATRLGWCASPTRPFDYTWTPGLYLSDSTAKDPLAYINETTKYYVTSIGGSDCPIIDSVTVTVPIHDYEIFPKDTSVCHYEPFQLIAGGTDFTSVQWYEYDQPTNTFTTPTSLSCNNCPNPIAVPALDTSMYAVVYTDKDNCTDTLYMNYEIRPLPPVSIINNDTTIKYGTDIMLIATGAFLYTWTPSASLSNPNVVNPMASPLDPTMYYVYGIGENGCKKIDSVMVNIDYGTNLFVPTAFTPNGDGKNDVFRVSNVNFHRLQEFKVFNRWGQELFNTNDIKKGWDGSWKGQPQDMGVYQYIIKLASPEGKIETYKGDVTLVR